MKRHYPVVAAFLIPAMALLVIFKIYPILLGVYELGLVPVLALVVLGVGI